MLLLHSHYRHHHHHQLQYHVGGAVIMQLEESQSFLVQKQPETKGLQMSDMHSCINTIPS